MSDDYLETQRAAKGFYTPTSLIATVGQQNRILDPYSVVISSKSTIGKGNVFYPNVIIEQRDEGHIAIGDNNVFYPGTYIYASHGKITIESQNEFGPAGLTIKANVPEVAIAIGSHGRFCDGASIMGASSLGSGSQILGAITVQGCILAEGGSSTEPNPDKRAAVLKGFGLARGLTLSTGQVVNGHGNFSDSPIETQRSYHPGAQK